MLGFLLRTLLLPSDTVYVSLLFTPVGAWAISRLWKRRYSEIPFAILNVVGAYLVCISASAQALSLMSLDREWLVWSAAFFLLYVLIVLANYALLVASRKEARLRSLSVWAPIATLIIFKYVPVAFFGGYRGVVKVGFHSLLGQPQVLFLGISYLSFRLCSLASEVQNNVVELPSVWDYLSFAFFVPTLTVGPISPFRMFVGSLRNPDRTRTPLGRSYLRISVGLTKYLFFGSILGQFTYGPLLLDGHPHHPIDLVIAIVAYPVFLFCNFSGFCDMVIGVSGIMGIEVMENFDQPFLARNLQEFWSRWHISLSAFLRDMLFTPLVKYLSRLWGVRSVNHAIAFSIMATFITIGLWHGATLHFLLFGFSQGLGVATVHYSTIYVKKRLGKERFAAYRANRLYYWLGCAMTCTYFALALFLFANTTQDMARIYEVLTHSNPATFAAPN